MALLSRGMRAGGHVDLTEARSDADRRLLERIYPLYLHELSAFTDYYELDERGRWRPDHLYGWLHDRLLHPLVARVEGKPVGFSFVSEAPFPHMHEGCNYQVSEFFVLNPWRRRGIGTAAALATFERFRGRWVVTELSSNGVALAFWRKVIGSCTGGRFEESASGEEVIQCFDNGS